MGGAVLLAAGLRLAEALRPIADRPGRTVAEVAIAWVLARPPAVRISVEAP
ncbi:hypothetical protein [Streptosporangium sandarakinum]|uniref:Aryl-alcohol dehydrogenase-like predicted oxidoreductase n=1 Tax=Streptosporangium sandarakinum TaxID=1260955 RepID=A0A852UZL3_9ACTN|nr:hypothetical protein [Streptosporangium sandarakinum]NYF41679.1 aryl-alcohol dehydrogenase-like predicted oxidoreductase [Streptosporangium sandarakinum]